MTVLREQTFFNGEQKLVASVGGPADGRGVLFLHGGGQTRHSWNSCAAALAEEGFHAISLDLRGHGDSSWAADGYAIELQIQDVLAVIQNFYKPPILVGASLGGLVSMNMLGAYPDSGRALVLVDITPGLNKAGGAQVRDFMQANPDGFDSLEQVSDTIAHYLPNRRRPTDLSGLKKNLRMRNGRWYWHWDPKMITSLSASVEQAEAGYAQACKNISVATLLIKGGQSEIVREEQVNYLLKLIPHADVVDVKDVGHMVAGDDNDMFMQVLKKFVMALPA